MAGLCGQLNEFPGGGRFLEAEFRRPASSSRLAPRRPPECRPADDSGDMAISLARRSGWK